MRNINLVDRSLLPPPPDWLGLGLLAAAAAGLLFTLGHYGYERTALRAALQASDPQAQADASATDDQELRELGERATQQAALRNALHQAGTGAEHLSSIFEGVTSALPPDMWLDSIELQHNRSLVIEGQALQAASLANFSEGLARVQVLKGLPVQAIELETVWPERAAEAASTESGSAAVPLHRFKLSGGRPAKDES